MTVFWSVSPDGHHFLLAASIRNNDEVSYKFELERYMDCGFQRPWVVCIDRNERLEADVMDTWSTATVYYQCFFLLLEIEREFIVDDKKELSERFVDKNEEERWERFMKLIP